MITFSAHCCLLILSLATCCVVYSKEVDAKIYFPDKTFPEQTHPKISTLSTRSAAGDCVGSFCRDAKDYPTEDLDKLLEHHPELHRFFDLLDTPSFLHQRGQMNPDDSEETLCEAKRDLIQPKTGNNTDNVPRIIYQGTKYQQFIYTEICSQKTCKFQKIFPNNYEVFCKQKYIQKKMVTVEVGKPSFDIFDVPCCCVCAVKTIP